MSAAAAQIENARLFGVIKKPEIDGHHIVNKNEVAHLGAGSVSAVVAKKFDFALVRKLVKLVKGDAGHATLVLFAGPIDIEVAKAHHLARFSDHRALKVRAALAPHALIKQELGVAVDIERTLKSGGFLEGVRAAIGGGAGRVQQARPAFLTGLKQTDRGGVVVVHHVLAIALHRVAAGPFVKHGLDLTECAMGEELIKRSCVHVICNFQIGEVAELVTLGQVVNRDDVVKSARIETFDQVGAYEAGRTGHNDSGHANNSS